MAAIYESKGSKVNLRGPQAGVGFQPVQAVDQSRQTLNEGMRRAEDSARVANQLLKNTASDIEAFKGFSNTLNDFLFKEAEKHNENEMKLGIAEVLNGNLTVKPDFKQNFEQGVNTLADAASSDAALSDAVADRVSPAVAEQARDSSPAIKGWRAYGQAIGKTKKAAAGSQQFLQEFMESDQPVVPIRGEDGSMRMLKPSEARTPAELAASLAVGRQMMVDTFDLAGINPLLVAENMTPQVMAVSEAIMTNRVAEARKAAQAEAIESVHGRIGAEINLLSPDSPEGVQKFWQETTRDLHILGRMGRGEANETVVKSFIQHAEALGRSDLLEALAGTPLITDQPNGPTVGDRFRPLFEGANRSIESYEDRLREKAEKAQDDAVDDLLSAHQLLMTTPGVGADQIKSSWTATTEGLRSLAAQGSRRAANELATLTQQGENYNPFLAADLARDIAAGRLPSAASIDELVRLGRIKPDEANDLKSRLPSSAATEKAKAFRPEIQRLVRGVYANTLAEQGITTTDAGSATALLEGQMADELEELTQTFVAQNPSASPAETRDFIRTRADALAKQQRFLPEIKDGRVVPKAALEQSSRVNRFLNPVTGNMTGDFTRATPAQVQTSRPVASRDLLISSQELAQNQQAFLQGGAPTPRVRAMMTATGKDWGTFLREQSNAYGTPFTNMSQAKAAAAAQQRRSLAPAAAAILSNPNATPQQRVRAWNDINAARQRAANAAAARQAGGGTTGPIDFNAAYNALVGKESGGDPSVLNRDGSGATGLGQVMPENIGPWTEKWLGRRMTQEEFRRNPEAQRRVVSAQFGQSIRDQISAGFSPDMALRRAAATWYSGNGDLHNSTAKQSWNGKPYPSVKEYVDDVVKRYNAGRQSSFSGARGGRANFTPQNVQSIRIETPGNSFQPGMDLWFADKNFGAVLPGRVKEIRQNNGNYGNMIVVESIDPQTGEKVDVVYSHLESIGVQEGDRIRPGTVIGRQGGTGRVSSADGTIASIDFLTPAPRGSNSMTPYRQWKQLANRIKQQIESGTFR
jgi:murein DD-endopeptidase MepM/ murein hydrolase activator NlpD